MTSSNTTAEERARAAWEMVKDPDRVTVRVPVTWYGQVCVPDGDGEEEVEAVFGTFTFGDNFVVEKATTTELEVSEGHQKILVSDPNEYRRLMLKKNLLAWSLPIEIERESGWLTPECYERVGNVSGPLMDALVDQFYRTTIITDDEESVMDRQSAALFSESSRGVSNACEAISLFCTLGSFWEKFGIDREILPRMPFKEYLSLKVMSKKEGDSMRSRSKTSKGSNTKIAGRGGRTRQSSGTRIAL